jgi:Big-like domain-containing protein
MRRGNRFKMAAATAGVAVALLTGALGVRPAAAAGSTPSTTTVAPVSDTSYGKTITFFGGTLDTDAGCALHHDDANCDPPLGTMDFYDNGAATPFASAQLAVGDLPCCGATVTLHFAGLPAGAHTVKLQYQGNDEFAPSDKSVSFNIAKADTTTTLTSPTANPSVTGQPVSLDAHVSPSTATGMVQFFENNQNLGSVPVVGGVAHESISPALGTHSYTALYKGDDNHQPSSTQQPLIRTVGAAGTTTALVSSANPSVFGQPVTFSSTTSVVAPGTGIPTGAVTFHITDASVSEFKTANLANGHAAASPTKPLAVGYDTESAAYGGDTNYAASTGMLTQVVNPADTTVALTSTPNPSTLGQAVTLGATIAVVAPGAGQPTGAVQFMSGAAKLGNPVPLNGSAASLTLSSLGGGANSITAQYLGDGNFNPSTSASLTQDVTCDRSYTGQVSSVSVSPTGTTCITAATVSGTLIIPAGAHVSLVGSTITGGVITTGAPGGVIMCSSTVKGSVGISNVTGLVLIGSPYDDACGGNTFGSGVTLTNNRAGLTFIGNQVTGTTQVSNNSGGATTIGANNVGGTLACLGNDPVAANGGHPNTVSGSRTGQCAGTF